MAFENIKNEIASLMQEMLNKPEDVPELEAQLREYLSSLRAQGLPVPEDLAELEKKLAEDFDV